MGGLQEEVAVGYGYLLYRKKQIKKWCLLPHSTQLIVHPETYSLRLFTSTTYVYDLTTYAEYVRSKTTTCMNLALVDLLIPHFEELVKFFLITR
jgi:hypothetical protein